MRYLLMLFPIALTACTTVPEAPVTTVAEPSLDAIRALPPEVPLDNLGLQGGCYVYQTEDGFVPLMTGTGQQICA